MLNRVLVILAGVLLASVAVAVSQEAASTDVLTGTWNLNTNKSSQSGIERESIRIELAGDQHKFVYDRLGENGTELNWWFVTDMKGDCVNHTQVNGQPMTSKSCISRLGPRTFVNDTAILHEKYELSSDGRKMVVHTKFKGHPTGRSLPEQKLVFDRVLSQ